MLHTHSVRRLLRSSSLIAVVLLAGCAGSKEGTTSEGIPSATLEAAQVRWADATVESLEQGRHIYLTSCNRCHAYPDIGKYSEEKWPHIMKSMGKKSRLTDEQTQLAERYLIATHVSTAAK